MLHKNTCQCHNLTQLQIEKNIVTGSCQFCFDQLQKINCKVFHSLDKQNQFDAIKLKLKDQISSLKFAISLIDHFRQSVQNGLDKIIQTIIETISTLQNFNESFENVVKKEGDIKLQEFNVDVELQKIADFSAKQSIQLSKLFEQIKVQNNFDDLFKEIQKQNYFQFSQDGKDGNGSKNQAKQVEINEKSVVQYSSLQNSTINTPDFICFSFAFNSDSSILFAGTTQYQILVFEFCEGIIKQQIQKINAHSNFVVCLEWMKKCNQLLSASDDKSIKIWKQDQHNNWTLKQKLEGHKNKINCLVVNKNEDFFISGSSDKTINIWMQKNIDLWICFQTIQVNFEVYSFSLNESSSKLVVCGASNQVLLFQFSNQQWIKVQNIDVVSEVYRVLFLNEKQFLFQQRNGSYLEIFNFREDKQQFLKHNQLYLENSGEQYLYFPYIYIKQKKILIAKNGKQLNIITLKEEGDLTLEQQLIYADTRLFGTASYDGEYLATWDGGKKIQIRKLNIENIFK